MAKEQKVILIAGKMDYADSNDIQSLINEGWLIKDTVVQTAGISTGSTVIRYVYSPVLIIFERELGIGL